jgi:GH15 family glucan-1,4-alpha-glucosidase
MATSVRSAAPHRRDGYLRLGEYAAIGDGRTLGLVGTDGSIDWMCLPNLDGSSIFGALLDPQAGGRFVIQPAIPFEASRRYIERTNVLETTFATAEGQVRLIDALTLDKSQVASWRELARRIEGLADTVDVWQSWTGRHTHEGPWTDAVERSLLAIRLLTDGRTGAIAAAGTTSLPEVIGGNRNYDYRFAWVRDASFSLDALLAVGMEELTHTSVTWLLESVSRTHPRVDPVYALDGSVVRSQSPVPIPGYRQTTPVHRGNQAGSQLQLGGFGDLLETVSLYVSHRHVLSPAIGERLADVVDLLGLIWRCEDAGLWELGQTAHYGTSKLGCWVAFERLLGLVERGQAPARHLDRWRRERDAVREFIDRKLWSEQKRSYLQKSGSDGLDCGMLLAARRGFGDSTGPRMNGTIDAIRAELGAGAPLLYRYSGMEEEENAFLACSFWLVEALALAQRLDEAAELMDGLVGLANDVGLYSEEIEPASKELRGNLPQALTHLSLINAATAFARATDGGGGGGDSS